MASIFFVFLLIAVSISSASADVTWSVDCGSSVSSVDVTGITWTADDGLVSTGESRSVPSSNYYLSYNVINTLRVFPSGTKNCYVLPGQKGTKVLLRASFYYGNYDGVSSPPSFDIQFDGNDWGTVTTNLDTRTYRFTEVIYVTQGNFINLCLIKTSPDQIPFISALEVRTLDFTVYQYVDSGHALFVRGRHAFGASQEIRYPYDIYGRIWEPTVITGGSYRTISNPTLPIDTSASPDNPPQAVLQNAITTSSFSGQSIVSKLTDLPENPVQVYLTMYFSELSQLFTTQKRAFSVYVKNVLMESSQGQEPPYGSVTELSIYNLNASSNTVFSLVSTSDSTEPPLINAMEVFQVSDSPVTYTASSSSKSKSKAPVYVGVGVPVVLIVVAVVIVTVMMHQKKQRAMMLAEAAAGGFNGQQGAVFSNEQEGQGRGVVMNDFQVNAWDPNEQMPGPGAYPSPQSHPYASPTPLVNARYN